MATIITRLKHILFLTLILAFFTMPFAHAEIGSPTKLISKAIRGIGDVFTNLTGDVTGGNYGVQRFILFIIIFVILYSTMKLSLEAKGWSHRNISLLAFILSLLTALLIKKTWLEFIYRGKLVSAIIGFVLFGLMIFLLIKAYHKDPSRRMSFFTGEIGWLMHLSRLIILVFCIVILYQIDQIFLSGSDPVFTSRAIKQIVSDYLFGIFNLVLIILWVVELFRLFGSFFKRAHELGNQAEEALLEIDRKGLDVLKKRHEHFNDRVKFFQEQEIKKIEREYDKKVVNAMKTLREEVATNTHTLEELKDKIVKLISYIDKVAGHPEAVNIIARSLPDITGFVQNYFHPLLKLSEEWNSSKTVAADEFNKELNDCKKLIDSLRQLHIQSGNYESQLLDLQNGYNNELKTLEALLQRNINNFQGYYNNVVNKLSSLQSLNDVTQLKNELNEVYASVEMMTRLETEFNKFLDTLEEINKKFILNLVRVKSNINAHIEHINNTSQMLESNYDKFKEYLQHHLLSLKGDAKKLSSAPLSTSHEIDLFNAFCHRLRGNLFSFAKEYNTFIKKNVSPLVKEEPFKDVCAVMNDFYVKFFNSGNVMNNVIGKLEDTKPTTDKKEGLELFVDNIDKMASEFNGIEKMFSGIRTK